MVQYREHNTLRSNCSTHWPFRRKSKALLCVVHFNLKTASSYQDCRGGTMGVSSLDNAEQQAHL